MSGWGTGSGWRRRQAAPTLQAVFVGGAPLMPVHAVSCRQGCWRCHRGVGRRRPSVVDEVGELVVTKPIAVDAGQALETTPGDERYRDFLLQHVPRCLGATAMDPHQPPAGRAVTYGRSGERDHQPRAGITAWARRGSNSAVLDTAPGSPMPRSSTIAADAEERRRVGSACFVVLDEAGS